MSGKPTNRVLRLLLLPALIGVVFVLMRVLGIGDFLRNFIAAVESVGVWGPIFFVLAYIAATVLLVPGSILTLGAGAAFGLWRGFALVSLGSTLGAVAAFLIGRYLARDRVRRRIAGSRRFEAIDEAIAKEGWKIVGLARLSPLIPFSLLNYALSLTRIGALPYALVSWLAMMPATLMYVYFGSLGNAGAREDMGAAQWTLFGVGLAATVAVTVLISRAALKEMEKRVKRGGEQAEN